MSVDDLKRDARLLGDVIASLDETCDVTLEGDDQTRDAFLALGILDAAAKVLTDVRKRLAHKIGEALADDEWHTLDGQSVRRRADVRRTKWQKDDLLRAVLDSRLVDSRTGEVADESPIDKVLHVYNLPAPRTTALRDRGLDPDEFSESRFEGWNLECR